MAQPNARNNPLGVFSYNKVAWDGLAKTKVSSEPVPDPSGRATKYVKHTIEVSGWLSTGADETLGVLTLQNAFLGTVGERRKALREPAKALIYTGRGYDLNVNDRGPVWDSANGPHPEVLSFVPLGGVAAYCEFRVTTQFPECATARYVDAVAANTWEITYEADTDGYLSISYAGVVEIASTLRGGRPVATVDSHLEEVIPLPLAGFQRGPVTRAISSDRRTMTLRFQDKQMPAAFPKGVANIELDYTVKSSFRPPFGFHTWECNLAGPITMPAGVPRGAAFRVFMDALSSQLNIARVAFQGRQIVAPIGRQRLGPVVMMTDLMFKEPKFGRTSNFSATWRLIGVTLATVVADSGLWRLLPGTSHAAWAASVRDSAQSPRGSLGMRQRVADDLVIDLCAPPRTRVAPGQVWPERGDGGRIGAAREQGPQARAEDDDDFDVDPENSWLAYVCDVVVVKNPHAAVHHPIGVQTAPIPVQFPVTGEVQRLARDTRPPGPDEVPQQGGKDVVQKIGKTTYTLRLEGYGTRAKYRVDPPRLAFVGGVDVRDTEGVTVTRERVSGKAGVRIFTTFFSVEYHLTDVPRSLPVAGNPNLAARGEQ